MVTEKINNNITSENINTTSEKKFILEWKGAELKDGTMRYERFEVIAGNEKEELKFYSTFFIDNPKFKKGEIYELTISGNFVQDDSEIIQGTDQGVSELERVSSSLMIKELWEEKESNLEKLNILEEELQQKKEDVNQANQNLLDAKSEVMRLQERLESLQSEKDKIEKAKEKVDKELDSVKAELQKEKESLMESERDLVNSKNETSRVQEKFNKLKNEKEKIENEWTSPKEKERLIQEKKESDNKLKKERRNNQILVESLENIHSQELKETIETKLNEKKKELEKLKVNITDKLGNDKFLLENFLEKQEDFDIALFDDASQTSRPFLRAKERLQEARDKLITKIGSGEFEELCDTQTEIGKLEASLNQWEKMNDQQKKEKEEQYESFMSTPPETPNSY